MSHEDSLPSKVGSLPPIPAWSTEPTHAELDKERPARWGWFVRIKLPWSSSPLGGRSISTVWRPTRAGALAAARRHMIRADRKATRVFGWTEIEEDS